jgi:hypothetical protein
VPNATAAAAANAPCLVFRGSSLPDSIRYSRSLSS